MEEKRASTNQPLIETAQPLDARRLSRLRRVSDFRHFETKQKSTLRGTDNGSSVEENNGNKNADGKIRKTRNSSVY